MDLPVKSIRISAEKKNMAFSFNFPFISGLSDQLSRFSSSAGAECALINARNDYFFPSFHLLYLIFSIVSSACVIVT